MQTPSTIEVGHGHALGADARVVGRDAARRAMGALSSHTPSLVLVFPSGPGAAQALDGVREVVGSAPLLGAAVDAPDLATAPPGATAVLVVALGSPELRARVGGGSGSCGVQGSLEAALSEAGDPPYLAGPAPWLAATRDGRSVFALVFAGSAEAARIVTAELSRRAGGRLPVFAAVAGGVGVGVGVSGGVPGQVLVGGRALPGGVALAIVDTTLDVGLATAPGAQAIREAVLCGRVSDPALALVAVPSSSGPAAEQVRSLAAAFGSVPVLLSAAPAEEAGGAGAVTVFVLGRELSREAHVARENQLLLERARRGEAQVRALLDSMTDHAWLKDPACRYVAVNRPFAEAAGTTPEAMVGTRDEDHFPRELARRSRADDELVMAEGRPLRLEEPFTDARGRTTWMETVKSPLRDEGGRVVGTAGIARDQTARKELERLRERAREDLESMVRERTAALRESEERYRLLVRGTPNSAVFLVDRDLRCTLAEGTLLEQLGRAPDGLVGRRVTGHPERVGGPLAKVLARAVLGESVEEEAEMAGRVLSLRAAPFRRGDGVLRGAMLVATDVTARTRLEEQVRQAQKLEAVGRLAGGIAHDFNNILTVILSSARDLGRRGKGDGEERELVQEVLEAGERAAALTRQLLAFSRQQALRPRELDLNEVVQGLVKMLRRLIGEDIVVSTALTPEPLPVLADPSQLEQVIVNLVVNARDAMPGGGRITIETARVEGAPGGPKQAPVAGPHAVVAVRDTGIGIDAATLEHVFEPFFTTKEPGKGTGLGLATVYGVVQQSGGTVAVESRPGAGTTFRVFLPRLAIEEAQPDPGVGGERAATGHEAVLLVEDDPSVRALMRRGLEGAGYRVVEAGHGAEALRVARLSIPDLLLTDVIMPGLGGPELAAALLAEAPALRVVFVSGYNEDAALRTGELPPGQAFLQKPFTGEELARVVRQTLDAPRAALSRPMR
ncbi:MAG TPA: PAS domain-containing protein [Anaeromyxobacteraceae bacterium]|nr:PAS domain-containing protein [Anaeromyxobacteraceae bacterium]